MVFFLVSVNCFDLFFMHLYFLFVSLSCALTIFAHKNTLHTFLFVVFAPHQLLLFFILCLNLFWPHQIASIKTDPFLCVHRHTLFICYFSSPCCVQTVLILFPTAVFNTCQKVINGVGWLDQGCPNQDPRRHVVNDEKIIYLRKIYWFGKM